jgi:acetylornithine deacetylase/succinyl-diaminopimelate desuccinylase-like protein
MDWKKIGEEAVHYLQDYIRVNTINPPGNETEGARFLKTILDREGIASELFEAAPGRGSLLGRLKGDGSKRPILLLSHIDVVPVEKERWEVDPFSGDIRNGYLYGRGSLDDKGMGIAELMALLLLKRGKTPLKRDILFFATADEETGGDLGVRWAMEKVAALGECEYALNEGGSIILDGQGVPDRYEISCGQKALCQITLRTRGTPGHGSMPHGDNPNVKLVQALDRLLRWETPFRVLPMVKEYFSKLAPRQPAAERAFFLDIERGLQNPTFARRISSSPIYNAMVRDTFSLNVLQGGSKVNVIPSDSTALVDCRLIPGSSPETFLKEVRARLGEDVEVSVLSESPSLPPSPRDTDLFRAIERWAAANVPGCPVVPHLLPGATDSRYLREKGITAYDVCPFRLSEKDLMLLHGHNERIALENLEFGTRMLMEILLDVAT